MREWLILLFLLVTAPAYAAEGVQVQGDGNGFLVSKDVGSERWAISLSLHDDALLVVTGNVFRGEGSEPAFLYCIPIDVENPDDLHRAIITYSCSGADRCTGETTCPPYTFIRDVTIPATFFIPP